jgi:hypothetical protein
MRPRATGGASGGIHSRRERGGSGGRDYSAPQLNDDEWVRPEKMV